MKCPVCSGGVFSEWGRVNGFVIQQCTSCGLGITTPFPGPEERGAVNRETYTLDERIKTYTSRRACFEERYRRQLRDIASFRQSGELLDIGCNIGMFLYEARSAGFDVAGVELNQECAGYARAHYSLDVRSEYLEHAGFAADSFDVVTMFDVLEHVPDLHAILEEVLRVLKPGGLLVVQSPNLDSVMADMTRPDWSWLSPPDHLYHFTPGSLMTLLVQSGYKVPLLKTWEPADDFCIDVMHAKLGSSFPSRIARKLLRVSGLAALAVSGIQKSWWRRQRGALVEAYAVSGKQP